ncbi:MAG: hypothetical protein Greene071436_340 [Parcubacteria group bacterium Greene0714_36]|nr:MAG: hypothetical protein Greene071436_340 [Parcubacteria group bacterium Greene0714_36]
MSKEKECWSWGWDCTAGEREPWSFWRNTAPRSPSRISGREGNWRQRSRSSRSTAAFGMCWADTARMISKTPISSSKIPACGAMSRRSNHERCGDFFPSVPLQNYRRHGHSRKVHDDIFDLEVPQTKISAYALRRQYPPLRPLHPAADTERRPRGAGAVQFSIGRSCAREKKPRGRGTHQSHGRPPQLASEQKRISGCQERDIPVPARER